MTNFGADPNFYQQDNPPCHTERVVMGKFEDMGVGTCDWTAQKNAQSNVPTAIYILLNTFGMN